MKLTDSLIKYINKKYDVDIRSRCRDRLNSDLRFIYFAFMREYTKINSKSLGKTVNRSHCLVLHGVKQFENCLKDLDWVQDLFEELAYASGIDENDYYKVDKLRMHYESKIREMRSEIQDLRLNIYELTNEKYDSVLTDFSLLPDSVKNDFVETRLKPYLKMIG